MNLKAFYCVEDDVQVINFLLDKKFDLIVFTGSTKKGKLVAKAAAKNLTPTILELGGKYSSIVDRDVNINNASLRII